MASKIVNLFQQDLDEVFAYSTTLRLVLRSQTLGIIFRALQILLLIYFFIIVFFVEYGYFNTEFADGTTIMENSAAGQGLFDQEEPGFWDGLDVTPAFTEGNTVFVSIKSNMRFKQKVDNCADFTRQCNADSQCITLIGETCKDGTCFGPNWCTPDGNSVAADYYVPDRFLIWIKSEASFQLIDSDDGFSTMEKQKSIMFPKKHANTFSVGQLLNDADVLYKEIREEGAIIKVNVYWDCYAKGGKCNPTVKASRIDKFNDQEALGATAIKFNYWKEGGVTYRNEISMTGIRFIFETRAIGKVFSFNKFILQLGTLIAFLRAIYYFFDFVIYNFLPGFENFKREKYTIYDDRKSDEEKKKDLENEEKKKKEAEEEKLQESDDGGRNLSEEDDEYEGASALESDDLLEDKD